MITILSILDNIYGKMKERCEEINFDTNSVLFHIYTRKLVKHTIQTGDFYLFTRISTDRKSSKLSLRDFPGKSHFVSEKNIFTK